MVPVADCRTVVSPQFADVPSSVGQADGVAAAAAWPVAPRLQQEHACAVRLGEARGEHTARGAAADDHEVVAVRYRMHGSPLTGHVRRFQ